MKKHKLPEDLEYSYRIYPPSGAHKGFRLLKYFKKTMRSETISLPELAEINSRFTSNKINEKTAREHIEELKFKLYERAGVLVSNVVNPENQKIFDKYWESEYVPRLGRLEDVDTAKNELLRAIKVLGAVSLRKASRQELQLQVSKMVSGNKQRRVVSKLNLLLKFIGRDFQLIQDKKVRNEVRHITIDDLPKLLEHLPDGEPMRLLHEVAFYTGCRLGEAFALDARTYNPGSDTIKILSQIDKEGRKRGTKNGKTRTTVVIPEGRAALEAWFRARSKLPHEVRLRIARYTRKAAIEAFPKQPSKHITFHDLRHSYAIHLLSKGVPISLVAQCLGDSITVAEEYYVGFDLSEGAIDLISRTLKSPDAL